MPAETDSLSLMRALLTETRSSVLQAQASIDNGQALDLSGLEMSMALLCARALDLPLPPQAASPRRSGDLAAADGAPVRNSEQACGVTGQMVSVAAIALIGVLALIGLLARLLQFTGWRAAPRTGRSLIVRETVALDPRRRLHLIECADRQVIVLTGGSQDLVIGWVKDP
jgi:flagellar protein FliO/FliZ